MANQLRRPGLVGCFAIVAATRLGLRLLGLRRTVRLARAAAGTVRPGRPAVAPTVAARTLVTAAAFFPGRAVCLEQSISLYVVLRRLGYDVALRIGVQPFPFEAHAWLELDGRPFFESEELVQRFIPFPQVIA